MIMLSERNVAQLLSMPETIDLLERQLRLQANGEAQTLPRRRARAGDFVMHVLAAASTGPELGAKLYLSGGEKTQFVYMLFGRSGLEAMIAADRLGRLRTGAASGLATKYLARRDARRLALFGTGNQAGFQAEAVCAVRPIQHITICARNTKRAEVFAASLQRQLQAEITVTDNAQTALADADVVCTMTSAQEPLFNGSDLPGQVHINAAGSNRATHREIDRATLDRASTIMVDDIDQAQLEAGDFLRNGDFDWTRVQALGDIFSFREPPAAGITLFESLGIGLWDLALATEIMKRARAQNLGIELDLRDFFQTP